MSYIQKRTWPTGLAQVGSNGQLLHTKATNGIVLNTCQDMLEAGQRSLWASSLV